MLEAPAYTKPNVFRGMPVPEVFLSGNHKAIAEWKLEHALERTRTNRPDLYEAWAAAHPEHFSPKKKKKKPLLLRITKIVSRGSNLFPPPLYARSAFPHKLPL